MEFSIRKMQEADIRQVQDVARTTWHATYEGIIPLAIQQRFLDSAYNDERMQQRLACSLMLVAETPEKIVGFANFSPVNEDGVVELAAIYILPEAQGNGIGSALLREAIAELDGVKEIYVDGEKDNLSGLSFYERKNFQVTREYDDDFDGHILKTVEMKLEV